MQKMASVNTRVDFALKQQAEAVLDELGMSMATAMKLFLKQIVIQNGIPFELKVPESKPVAYSSLTEDEFNSLMEKAFMSYSSGQGISLDAFENQLREEAVI